MQLDFMHKVACSIWIQHWVSLLRKSHLCLAMHINESLYSPVRNFVHTDPGQRLDHAPETFQIMIFSFQQRGCYQAYASVYAVSETCVVHELAQVLGRNIQ